MIDLNAPFELGECKEITLKVYLPKDTNAYLGDENKIATVMADKLNKLYSELVKQEHWQSDQLWFKPKEMPND